MCRVQAQKQQLATVAVLDSSHDKVHRQIFPLASVVGTDRHGCARRLDVAASKMPKVLWWSND